VCVSPLLGAHFQSDKHAVETHELKLKHKRNYETHKRGGGPPGDQGLEDNEEVVEDGGALFHGLLVVVTN